MEKIELVKRLIRANNYQHCERIFEQCVELGLHVNRVGLERFVQKLELIDKAERQRARRQAQQLQELHEFEQQTRQSASRRSHLQPPARIEIAPVAQQQRPKQPLKQPTNRPAPVEEKVITTTVEEEVLSYEEVKQREAEITLELGAMKIREHQLIEELNALSNKLKQKH